MTTAPLSDAVTSLTALSRPPYSALARAAFRESATCWAVTRVPSEKPGAAVQGDGPAQPVAADRGGAGQHRLGLKIPVQLVQSLVHSPARSRFTWLWLVMGWRDAVGS